jgi:DNA-binding Lrp family transcriptional regulator
LERVLIDFIPEVKSKFSKVKPSKKPQRSAYVFMTTESGANQVALEELKKIAEVAEVYLAHGAYDLVAKINGESFDHLKEVIHRRIGNLSHIKSTLTLTLI